MHPSRLVSAFSTDIHTCAAPLLSFDSVTPYYVGL